MYENEMKAKFFGKKKNLNEDQPLTEQEKLESCKKLLVPEEGDGKAPEEIQEEQNDALNDSEEHYNNVIGFLKRSKHLQKH